MTSLDFKICNLFKNSQNPYRFVNGEVIETKESDKYSFQSDNPCEKKLVIKNCEFIDEGAVKIQFVGGVESKAALKVG